MQDKNKQNLILMYANRLKLSVHNIAAAIVLTALCATVGFVAFPVSNDAQAAIPKIINFQGKLTAVSNGNNVANGTYAFEFKIYDAVTSGTLLWTETFDQPSGACGKLTVTNGVFNAKLGSCNALTGVDFTGGSLYLTVNFAPTGTSYDGEMSPRKQLVSSAFAFVANSVSGDGLVNNAIQSTTALATGRTLANPALQVDTNTASSATGLKVTSAAAAGGLALTTISSGTNENLTIDAKGSGTININGSATGDILLGGGSASTGCTVTNSSGALACTAGGSFTTLGLSGAISGATGITSSGTITFSGLGGGGTQCVTADNTGVLGVAACGSAITPWTSDIDADGFDLQDLSNVEFRETTGAPAGSVVAIFRDNSGDLTANVLTGKTYNIAVNGTDEYNFSSTTLNLNSNTITNAASFNGLVVTANTGVVTTGTWQGTAVADTYVADTLTVDSSSSVHWNALNNYPAACSAGSAISQLADTTNTCTAFNTDTSITLQDAYDATSGNTITTTTARNIAFVLGEVATPTSLTLENQDTAGTSAQRIFNSIASGTLTNGLLIEQTGAGTMTNGIQIAETSGTITDGILITGTLGNILNSASVDITGAGAITGATGFNGLVVTANTGVVTTGTWNGTAIGSQYGGTGQNWSGTSGLPSLNSGTWSANAITQNGVAYGGASNAMSFTAQGGANTVLVANAGAPSFSAAITVGTSVTSPTINATTALQFGGANINTAGTLTNVAYLNQANVFTADQTVTKADPSIVLNVTTATDTDFWLGVQDDAGGDDDDIFQIGDGTTPGTNPFLTINTSGNVGIGVTAPLSLLHVQQSADSTGTSNPIALNVNSVGAAGELTASSGVQVFSQIAPYINQTSTAGYTALLINATHNGTGSGTKNLIDFQVGGSSLARVDSTGKLFTPAVQGTSNLTITANPGNYVYIGDNADIVVQNRVAYLGNPGMYPNTPTQITSDQNDYSLPNDGKSWHRLSTDASRNITGFAPSYSTAQAGIFDLITNVGSFNIVLKHQDTGSTAANRLLNSTGADITLAPNESADIIYDATVSRWRVYKRADGAGTGGQTPWTSAIDADGYALQDALNIEFRTAAGSAPAGSVIAVYADNSGDLTANVLTGKTYNIAVNGTDEYNFSSTALAMNSNNITGLGTTLSATAGLTIGTTSADLALQTTTSGNITATTATTSGIFNVLTGNLKVGAGSPGVTLNGDDAYITGTFEVDGAAQFDGAVTNNSTATFNGLATFNTDADFTYAGTENIAITNTTGSNAVDLISLTLTNNDAGSAVQRGIAVNNADSTAVTDSGIFINNADTTSASLLDGILITSTGVNNGITDAIDVSDGNINNALNVGANTITGAGYLVTSTASGLTLNSTSANLAIQTTTSGNITMAPASTGSVQITAGTTTGTGTSAGLSVATSTATSGSAVDITVTGANALTNQKGINVSTSGAVTGAQTTYGGYFSNTHSGASAVNVGLYATASGASGANYAAIFDQGNVGIGDTSPLSLLTVGSGDLFQVASTGATTITSAQSATLGVTNTADSPGSYVATFTGSTGTNGTSGVLSTTKGFSQFIARSSTHTDRELRFQVFSDGVTYFGPTTTSGTVDADLIIRTSADAGSNTGDITISPGGSALAYFMNGGVVGIGTSGADRKLDVLDASNPQLRLTTTDGTVYGDFQNTANANAIITGNTFTSSSAKQYGLQVAPTINQTSSASYTGLDVNVTETAATTLNGLNRIADFRVGGSSKVAITPSGTIQIQNGGNFISSYSSLGSFQNHLVRSQEFDNASWVKTNVTAPTANTQNGPDGSATAESLATSSSGGDVCQWSGTAAGSNTFTFSVWARSSSGTQNFDLRIDAGATSCATANNVTGTAVTHTATTSWQRFSVTQTFSSATGNVKTRIFPGGTGGTGTVYAWGAQLDQASTAGGYAFTTGGALTNTNRGETLLSNFATTSGFTYGGRHIVGLEGAISASSSTIGEFIRVIDNATGTDDTATVRGLEVQAFSGTNINGINTGIASFGYTFGVHAVSTGQANEAVQPAALFADLDNGSAPTQGNAIRAYSNDLTSADLVSFYQETSAFTGNGLEMNFGVGAGSFTGNFISLQKAGTENFRVDDTGEVYLTTTATTSLNGLCHASTGAATADRVVDCSGTPSDIAEWYETKPDTQAAEIVSMTDEQFTYSEKDFNPFTGLPTGTTTQHSISILQKSLKAYDSKLFGVVSTSPNQVMGEAVRDKGAHPLPIALKGRVLVKVTNENGEIKAGDYITSSATVPGAGMKASRSGQVVGRAMNNFDAASGTVLVFMEVGFQSIGNAIVLDAPTIDGQNLQSGNEDLTSNAASTFVIQQQGAEGDETGGAVSDILQLQSGDSNRFMVSSTGATSILSNLTCTEEDEDTGAISCPSVLKVTQADTELMNIDAHGTLTLAGTIFIKDDSFAGSIATDENGLAEITFSYNLGTGKPVVQLTAEASIPVFAQIMEFKQDEHGNYTGFVMKTFDLISGPIQAIVHYNVTGKQEGYITLGEVLDEPQVPVFSGYSGDDGQVSGDYTGGDGAGLIIENGEVVGGDGNEDSDSIQTNDGSGEISNSDNSGLGGGI